MSSLVKTKISLQNEAYINKNFDKDAYKKDAQPKVIPPILAYTVGETQEIFKSIFEACYGEFKSDGDYVVVHNIVVHYQAHFGEGYLVGRLTNFAVPVPNDNAKLDANYTFSINESNEIKIKRIFGNKKALMRFVPVTHKLDNDDN